ncbi:MAG: hypothetical protein CME21_11335 [Gemmatimonadetes bacterium]|nr:hypothetical protein [Gemmatimonadota bacterium]
MISKGAIQPAPAEDEPRISQLVVHQDLKQPVDQSLLQVLVIQTVPQVGEILRVVLDVVELPVGG